MTEDTPPGAGDATAQTSSPIQIVSQYIKDLSFEVPEAPQIFSMAAESPSNLSVSALVKSEHMGGSSYEVVLSFHIGATIDDHTAFLIELAYGCVAVLDETVIPEQQIHPIIHIEIPRILFPFPRQIIADLSANVGFPPLLLQVIDFADLYAKRFGVKPEQSGLEDSSAENEPPPALN